MIESPTQISHANIINLNIHQRVPPRPTPCIPLFTFQALPIFFHQAQLQSYFE